MSIYEYTLHINIYANTSHIYIPCGTGGTLRMTVYAFMYSYVHTCIYIHTYTSIHFLYKYTVKYASHIHTDHAALEVRLA
jgi:hypothetical protein